MKAKSVLTVFIALLILSLAVAFSVFPFMKGSTPLPVLGQVQAFTLKDSGGQEFNSDQLRGKVWIASFFFTTCSGVCPMISKNMAFLSRTFERLENIHLVSITVNPEQDSPEVLARYAERYKGDRQNWHFLTGSREAVTDVIVGSFKVGNMKEPVFHTTYFPLVDSRGFIRGYYDGAKDSEISRLLKDAIHLAHR